MGLWKMGVGININNNAFRFGTRLQGLLSAALTTGNTLSYDNDTGAADGQSDGLKKYLVAGDKVLIGPSTYANYEGATQVVTVTTVSTTQIGFSETLTADFADNDPITAIGSSTPDGWIPNVSDSTILPYRLFGSQALAGLSARGYYNKYRMQFYVNGTSSRGMHCTLNDDEFVASTVHRMGCYYQYDGTPTNAGALAMAVQDSATNPWGAAESSITSVDQATWTAFAATVTSPSSLGASWWKIYTAISGLGGGEVAAANIANIFLEHAENTDDEASGVYTFDDYPSFGSRKYEEIGGSSFSRLRNNFMVQGSSMGSPDQILKHVVSASFKDASRDLRDNLAILLEYQQSGSPLVFHHDIPNIPNNLYGFMNIKDTNFSHWSENYCSFNVMFEER